MTEQLIEFETAKLAKEKGFDIPQNKMYSFGKEMFGYIDVVKFHNGDKHECLSSLYDWNSTKSPTSTKYYLAPTQSVLQKWLREKYDIDVLINTYRSQSNKWYKFFISEQNKDVFKSFDFNTYETALEIGLQEALKLIQNSKPSHINQL